MVPGVGGIGILHALWTPRFAFFLLFFEKSFIGLCFSFFLYGLIHNFGTAALMQQCVSACWKRLNQPLLMETNLERCQIFKVSYAL